MATNGIDKDYRYDVLIPYPVYIHVFRKDPNLSFDGLAISDEELYQGWLLERDGNNFKLHQHHITHRLELITRIVNIEECEE